MRVRVVGYDVQLPLKSPVCKRPDLDVSLDEIPLPVVVFDNEIFQVGHGRYNKKPKVTKRSASSVERWLAVSITHLWIAYQAASGPFDKVWRMVSRRVCVLRIRLWASSRRSVRGTAPAHVATGDAVSAGTRCRCIVSISFLRSMGLVAYSLQPARMHFWRSPSMAWAVRAMIAPE